MTKKLTNLEKRVKVWTIQEFIDAGLTEPSKFLIEELVPEGKLGMCVGAQKTNKTTIAYLIAKAIADPNIDECLGHKVLEHGHVLYIAFEGSIKTQINSFGPVKPNENFSYIQDHYYTLDNASRFNDLVDFMKENNTKLFIIDSMYKATDRPLANASDIRPTLIKLEALCHENNITVLMLHHTGRTTGKAEQDMNDVSGSFNIVRSSEFTLFLSAEPKTEEEEKAEMTMTKEEIKLLPKRRILKKMDYREGGEGIDKYSVDIYFGPENAQKGYVDVYRYNAKKQKVNPNDRTEDLINCAIELLPGIEKFHKRDLSKLLAEKYPNLTESSIEKNYTKKVIDALCARHLVKRISKIEGYKSLLHDDKNVYEQLPF